MCVMCVMVFLLYILNYHLSIVKSMFKNLITYFECIEDLQIIFYYGDFDFLTNCSYFKCNECFH